MISVLSPMFVEGAEARAHPIGPSGLQNGSTMRQLCLTSTGFKTSLQAILLAAVLLFPSDVRGAALAREVTFDIEPQPLESAIIKFSKQAEIQVLASSIDLDGVKSSGVKGRQRIEAGLQALLARTGLSYKTVSDETVAL